MHLTLPLADAALKADCSAMTGSNRIKDFPAKNQGVAFIRLGEKPSRMR